MKLNEKIFSCRKRAGLSQEELAERIGVSRQAVSKWELGTAAPELDKLVALAREFSVTTDWLLSEEGEEDPKDGTEETKTPHTWVQDVPGLIGWMLRKYGWLFGVYLSVAGAGFAGIGALARKAVSGMMSMIPGGMYVTGQWGSSISGTPGMTSFMQNNPVYIMGTAIMWVGVAMIAAGIVLAIVLKKKGGN